MTERAATLIVFNVKARALVTQRAAWSLWCELKPHLTEHQAARLKDAWFACCDGKGAAQLDRVTAEIQGEWST
jgi:hypothetical protein